jgi:heptosyltransferase-2
MTVPPPLGSVEKILVRGVNWIGDTILTIPALEGLSRLLPHASITLLVRDHLRTLFRNAPWVSQVLALPQAGGTALLQEEARLVRRIRGERFDLALIFPRSPRAALPSFLAGIPYRLGYACNGRGVLLTHGLPETVQLLRCHQADYFYHLVQFLGDCGARELPRLYISRDDDSWAESLYAEAGFSQDDLLIALNPGSTYGPAKCWPPGRYVELARRLLCLPRNRLLLVGGADNDSLVEYIYLSLNRRAIRVVGKDLMGLAALLKRCHLLITNDTGPMHLAAAVGTPVIALFGSTDPLTTSPLGPRSRVIRRQTDCSPCLKRRCPRDHRCMVGISVDDVEAVVMEQTASSGGHVPNRFKDSRISPYSGG